ncbi:hypothetical protein K439DRAFT_1659355 [Ramaria rubella]|nr:hypothetical protein K439DRAFT_1659355 [Ramaria rubella]
MVLPSNINPAAIYRSVLYGAMLSAILTGINICQTYGYVLSNLDRRLFKGVVILLVLLDMLGTLVTILILDHNVIGAFGEPIDAALNSVPSYYLLEILGNVIIATTAQSYISWIIYRVDGRWWPLCVLILIGALGELGLGIYIMDKTAHLGSLSAISGGSYHLITGIWPAVASFVDIIATIGLCTLLHTVRTPFKSTDHIINRIKFNLINRGILITIVQLLFVALWFAQPTTLNWTSFYFSTGKLYLTTLRTFISERPTQLDSTDIDCDSLTVALLNMRTQDKLHNMDSLDGQRYNLTNRGNNSGRKTNQNGTTLVETPTVHIGRTVEIFHENVRVLVILPLRSILEPPLPKFPSAEFLSDR